MTERLQQQDLVAQHAQQNNTADQQGTMTALGELQRQASILTQDNAELRQHLQCAQEAVASASAWNMRYNEEMNEMIQYMKITMK